MILRALVSPFTAGPQSPVGGLFCRKLYHSRRVFQHSFPPPPPPSIFRAYPLLGAAPSLFQTRRDLFRELPFLGPFPPPKAGGPRGCWSENAPGFCTTGTKQLASSPFLCYIIFVELCKINKNAHTGLYPFADAARTPHGDSNMSNLPITLI